MKTVKGYHFTGETLRNGAPIPKKGVWLKHKGIIRPCAYGLHMSTHPFDALSFAPGVLLHKVELRGDIKEHGNPVDKLVGRERRIIQTIDATDILREAARSWALDVLHLWDAPDVVREYLETGNEDLRYAARDAARYAAWAAAWAARDAARYAAWAARDAWDAAWAARAAAWAAARDAARDAAWDAQRKEFLNAIEAEFIIQGLEGK